MAHSTTRATARGLSGRGRRAPKPAFFPEGMTSNLRKRASELAGLAIIALGAALTVALLTYHPGDPSWNTSGGGLAARNAFGAVGAFPADLLIQTLGIGAFSVGLVFAIWGWRLLRHHEMGQVWLRVIGLLGGLLLTAIALAPFPAPAFWPGHASLGGAVGLLLIGRIGELLLLHLEPIDQAWIATFAALLAIVAWIAAVGLSVKEWRVVGNRAVGSSRSAGQIAWRGARLGIHGLMVAGHYARLGAGYAAQRIGALRRDTPAPASEDGVTETVSPRPRTAPAPAPSKKSKPQVAPKPQPLPAGRRAADERQRSLNLEPGSDYELPPVDLLALPDQSRRPERMDDEALRRNAAMLEGVLSDFGVRGEIGQVNPGPVVTLYELEPAPGIKSSRVIGLSDDIARSMSAVSTRVAVVPGRNAIGIELPNAKRETVYLRELLASDAYEKSSAKLPLSLGKDIGGAPRIADLARMPHLLVAGTTGSGKSVAINTMILSLLYHLSPEQVRLILVDPKMLELSVYEGIPHLLAPVVTEPKQAVVALKWAVREMENRYRAMSRMGVRNVEGYNQRLREAKRRGDTLMRRVQTGFDPDTGKPLFEEQPLDLTELPYIVVVVDEMADLMLVAGKDIEAAIQRLAQMARAAGIHLIMATQRPSVDVITGTIKANFPTRISFQVTSKIDSRTILGEQGAEQLLGLGDMLFMAGGGRIMRIHGPFVSDREVEAVVGFLKTQGEPDYNDAVLEDDLEQGGFDALLGGGGNGESGDELYDQAVALVARERKASTSFIQRHLQIGYNRAARIIERMETEGVVSAANHVGRREVLLRRESEV